VLAGSAAYAIGETFRWRVGLSRKPRQAIPFYGVLGAATLFGAGIILTTLDPMQALYWSAVINGVVAVPVMIIMMLIASSPKVMGKFAVYGWLLPHLDDATSRVRAWREGVAAAGVLDEPATVTSLLRYLRFAVSSGAVDEAEVLETTGLARDELLGERRGG